MEALKYIFIIGSSRSGTTMMSRVFANNSLVYTFNELHFFSQIFTKYKKLKLEHSVAINILAELFKRQKDGLFSKKDISGFFNLSKKVLPKKNYNVLEIFKVFVDFELKEKQKKIACFHTPNNIYYLENIISEFPNSKFINMVRDNRDVLLSQKNKWKRKFLGANKIPLIESLRSFANYHPITTSVVWNSSLKITMKYEDRPEFFILKFEDFLISPEAKCIQLCQFLNLEYQPKMLSIANIGSSNTSDSKEKTIDVSKVKKWEEGDLSDSEIYLAQFFSKPIMNNFKYKPKVFVFPPIFVLYYFISFPIKIFLAFIFNFSRISSVKNFLNFKK